VLEREQGGYMRTGRELASAAAAGLGAVPARMPLTFESSLPGVFAIGDVRSGAVKRMATAVGDGSMVIRMVHDYLSSRYGPAHRRIKRRNPARGGPGGGGGVGTARRRWPGGRERQRVISRQPLAHRRRRPSHANRGKPAKREVIVVIGAEGGAWVVISSMAGYMFPPLDRRA